MPMERFLTGYQTFREKYVTDDQSTMKYLSIYGQNPEIMFVACCDSRVDPALILQCDPGDLFVVRNVANIVPPFEKDEMHHGTSASLEFGICFLRVKHLVLLGHSQCGGIQALFNNDNQIQNDFISNWVSIVKRDDCCSHSPDDYAKLALHKSYQNCMTFPWIKEKLLNKELDIHLWFFDIKLGKILSYCEKDETFKPLEV